MEKTRAVEILEALASGCCPMTGEILPEESVLNQRDVIRALQIGIDYLWVNIKIDDSTSKKNKTKKTQPWKEIDYFEQPNLKYLSEQEIKELEEEIEKLGINKIDNISEYVQKARTIYPRAYEPWSEREIELLEKAIENTNYLPSLCKCFKRSPSSIRSQGQKIIYAQQQ